MVANCTQRTNLQCWVHSVLCVHLSQYGCTVDWLAQTIATGLVLYVLVRRCYRFINYSSSVQRVCTRAPASTPETPPWLVKKAKITLAHPDQRHAEN